MLLSVMIVNQGCVAGKEEPEGTSAGPLQLAIR